MTSLTAEADSFIGQPQNLLGRSPEGARRDSPSPFATPITLAQGCDTTRSRACVPSPDSPDGSSRQSPRGNLMALIYVTSLTAEADSDVTCLVVRSSGSLRSAQRVFFTQRDSLRTGGDASLDGRPRSLLAGGFVRRSTFQARRRTWNVGWKRSSLSNEGVTMSSLLVGWTRPEMVQRSPSEEGGGRHLEEQTRFPFVGELRRIDPRHALCTELQ